MINDIIALFLLESFLVRISVMENLPSLIFY